MTSGHVWTKRLQQMEDVATIFLVFLESIVSSITFFLPEPVIHFFTNTIKFIFKNPILLGYTSKSKDRNPIYDKYINDEDNGEDDAFINKVESLRRAKNFKEIMKINNYKFSNHLVITEDEYLLCLQRLNPKDNGIEPNGKVVYFQHGLLMNSEVWVIMYEHDLNLPFILLKQGYDVWFGNNRGNKYSNKHVKLNINDLKFWDFSIDEFAIYDIPNSINYILKYTNKSKLSYIGFSQGCSQALAAISINYELNAKIDKLILISPATTPHGLSNWLINTMVNWSPNLMYKVFGQKILLKSAIFWKNIIYPPFFIKLIDFSNLLLFNWRSDNINILQKFISYFHLYSTTSVKCVVHWFQIMKSKKFQMYCNYNYTDNDKNFEILEYGTEQIKIDKVLLIYGISDSLVDIEIIKSQLPKYDTRAYYYSITGVKHEGAYQEDRFLNGENPETVLEMNGDIAPDVKDDNTVEFGKEMTIVGVEKHEHLDLIWGCDIGAAVLGNVAKFLSK